MRNKTSAPQIAAIAVGTALLLAAALFLLLSRLSAERAEIDCDAAAAYMESVLPTRTAGLKEDRANKNMPALSYGGQDFSALLTVKRLSVKLPVRASWDKSAVNSVPCVFTGNPYDGTLIIGGVDAEGQFDFVPKIDVGDEIAVTDMKGYEFVYTVSTVKHAKNSKASTLIDGEYDLTLFTKDKRTGDWLLVRCRMKQGRK